MVDRKRIGILITWGIISFMIFGGLCYYHELTHQAIYDAYGINSTIDVGFKEMTTTPESGLMDHDEYAAMEAMHAITEIVSYQYGAIFFMQMAILLLVLLK